MKLTAVDGVCGGMRRIGWWIALTALMTLPAGRGASAQGVTTTTVQGTVYLANGQPGAGTLVVSWPSFTTAAGQSIAADQLTVAIPADGFVSVNLAPNQGATPAGDYYTATYYMSDGSTSTQYWIVPSAAQATIGQVQAQLMPATEAVQAVTKAYVDESIAEAQQSGLTASGGTLTGPLTLSADPTQPLQAADKHYVDSQVATAVPLSGGTLAGPLILSSDPSQALQAADKEYVDTAAAAAQITANAALPANGCSSTSGGNVNCPGTVAAGTATANEALWATMPTYNVMSPTWGAKAVGSGHDDTTAIQNAINAANAAGGGTIYFPCTAVGGYYNVTSMLTVYGSNIRLKGEHFGCAAINYTGTSTVAAVVQICQSSGTCLSGGSAVEDYVEDLTVTGNGNNTDDLYIGGGWGNVVDDVNLGSANPSSGNAIYIYDNVGDTFNRIMICNYSPDGGTGWCNTGEYPYNGIYVDGTNGSQATTTSTFREFFISHLPGTAVTTTGSVQLVTFIDAQVSGNHQNFNINGSQITLLGGLSEGAGSNATADVINGQNNSMVGMVDSTVGLTLEGTNNVLSGGTELETPLTVASTAMNDTLSDVMLCNASPRPGVTDNSLNTSYYSISECWESVPWPTTNFPTNEIAVGTSLANGAINLEDAGFWEILNSTSTPQPLSPKVFPTGKAWLLHLFGQVENYYGSSGQPVDVWLTDQSNTVTVGSNSITFQVDGTTGYLEMTSATANMQFEGKFQFVIYPTAAGSEPSTLVQYGTGVAMKGITVNGGTTMTNSHGTGGYVQESDGTGTSGSLAEFNSNGSTTNGPAPPASALVGISDTQTLTNKSIAGSEVNSGTVAAAQMPAFSGDCTTTAGATALTCTKTSGASFAASATSTTAGTGLNGAAAPDSANELSTGSTGQLAAATAHNQSAVAACATTNSGNAYSCTTSPSFTPAAGDQLNVDFNAANTGSATLNVNSAGAKTIYKWGNTSTLISGDIQSGHYIRATYDGSHWQLEGQLGNATVNDGSGSSTAGLGLVSTTTAHSYTVSSYPMTQTVASGSLALATSAISSASCQTVTAGSVNSAAATGVATTDTIQFIPNGSIKAVTGYTPSTGGGLTITPYPTAGYVNFDVCNWTASSITPGAVTLNWRVTR